jgi:hypothetical protein
MKITADLANGILTLPDDVYLISNRLKTIRDGTRAAGDIVRSIPDNLPYDPQPFPRGTWRVTGIDWQKDKGFDYRTYGPVKIRTDAWQRVKIWELDRDGDYRRETDLQVMDMCYWLHYSAFTTTLGCIRLASPEDAAVIARTIASVMDSEEVVIEVV